MFALLARWFIGTEGVYEMVDGEPCVTVLIEILNPTAPVPVVSASLRRAGWQGHLVIPWWSKTCLKVISVWQNHVDAVVHAALFNVRGYC